VMRERVRDWRTRLVEWAALQVGQPFAWGKTDCATLARSALRECFGEDVAPEVPTWSTKKEAMRVLKQHQPLQILESLGAEQKSIAFARAGDIVSLPSDDAGELALGVWIDGACLVSSKKAGVQLVPAADMPRDCIAYSLWEIQATDG